MRKQKIKEMVFALMDKDHNAAEELLSLVLEDHARNILLEQDDDAEGGNEPPRDPREYGTLNIPFSNWESFEEALARINKKAVKYGAEPLTIAQKDKISLGKKKDGTPIHGWKVILHGQPVKISGWEFMATIEHHDKANVIRFVPGRFDQKINDYIKASNRNCDFCHSARDRNHTFIVKNAEDGGLKQVGGQCLQKYIGDGARKLANFTFHMADVLYGYEDDDDGFGGGGGGRAKPHPHDVLTVLASSAVVIDKHGYHKRDIDGTGNGIPTINWVHCALNGMCWEKQTEEERTMLTLMRNPPSKFNTIAQEILDWFEALPDDEKDSSAYLSSLNSIIKADMVNPRSLGLVVSLVATFNRRQQQNVEKATRVPSQWVGQEKQKIGPLDVTVVYTYIGMGNYGQYQLVKMKTDDGNMLTWFNTSANEMENGKRYTIAGTIKKLEEYKGEKQTTLTRVKFNEIA